MCGVVWKQGATAYKCRDCESDPTCAICVQCFADGKSLPRLSINTLGDHTGHDYYMITTGGGCCDCGDRAAWKESGFCKNHRGPSGDPTIYIPQRMRPTITCAVRSAVKWLCYLVSSKTEEDAAIQFSDSIHTLCKTGGEGLGRIVSQALCEKSLGEELLPLSVLLLTDTTLSKELKAVLHMLYFHLIGDQYFKSVLAKEFIKHYAALIQSSLIEDYDDDNVLSFSVQLFTVKGLTTDMIRSTDLLEVLCGTAVTVFNQMKLDRPPLPPSIDLDNFIVVKKHYWRIFHDLRYVIQQPECCQALLFERELALKSFIQLLCLMQRLNNQSREIHMHLAYPPSLWIQSFNMVCLAHFWY